ncbi:OmpA family protein [Variovorax sp. PBL-E5]|uniref:OmpA family protein n=1 Tax=Variovorax sp. PBL-E5 TaxID=434014 RepID=UPI001316E8CC|nr:OmpA family protein [Variovorax sp. PBL-E5]VTU35885.1 type VI secretion system OmpA/MotB family protein [Variovorax sp. PBL-E5]
MKPDPHAGLAMLSRLLAMLAMVVLVACGTAPPPPARSAAPQPPAATTAAPVAAAAPAPAAVAPPPPIMPFGEAVTFAATSLFGNAALPEGAGKLPLVIDPLIDGNTGAQSVATQTMEQRITAMLQTSFPRYDLQPFSTGSLARAPLLFIGTFTAVDKDGKNAPGPREWYRVCLALVDLHSGKIVSKGFARARPDGVDPTPTAFFQDSPAWTPDPATDGYVRTCQGTKVGDPINPAYWDKIVAAAMINDAMTSYNAGRYDEALDLYRGVARVGGGDQLRVYNGLYLSSWKLGRKDEAAQAFSKIVDYGLAQKRIAVKFLFRPGSTLFLGDTQISAQYPVWLKQIASRAGQSTACMEVSGHTSRTGPEPLNDRLSLMRAQYVAQRLDAGTPGVARRTVAVGKGSREPISGLGTDDARDALDRRVEFKVIDCPAA